MSRELRFRTPHQCQNGHFRWLYTTIERGEVHESWGERQPECPCPTTQRGQGFSPIGQSQQFTGVKDKNGRGIFEGDVYKVYAEGRRRVVYTKVVSWTRTGFNIRKPENIEIVGNPYDNPQLLRTGGWIKASAVRLEGGK